jgi:hypothetical protein
MNRKGQVAPKHLSTMETVINYCKEIKKCRMMVKIPKCSNTCKFFEECPTLPNSCMHIFNVSIRTVHNLENVSLKV